MERDSEFKRLESYIERLLENYTAMKAENRRLDRDLKDLKAENDALRGEIGLLQSEKTEVGSRVERIISRIEAWESELDSSAGDAAVEETVTDEGGELENVENENGEKATTAEAETSEERGGGVQTNLFAAERGAVRKTAVQS
jgi:chromosome segregation ATPase